MDVNFRCELEPSSLAFSSFIRDNSDDPYGRAVVIGRAGIANGYDLLNIIILDKLVDLLVEVIQFFLGVEYP